MLYKAVAFLSCLSIAPSVSCHDQLTITCPPNVAITCTESEDSNNCDNLVTSALDWSKNGKICTFVADEKEEEAIKISDLQPIVTECNSQPENHQYQVPRGNFNTHYLLPLITKYSEFITKKNVRDQAAQSTEIKETYKNYEKAIIKKHGKINTHLAKFKITTQYFKSFQGACGDCAMHSLNNILGGHYFTSLSLGNVFKHGEHTKLSETEKKQLEKPYAFQAIYSDDDSGKTNALYYEGFSDETIAQGLSVSNVLQEKVIGADLYGSPAVLAALLNKQQKEMPKGSTLLGLRFTYFTDWNMGHSVGIHYIKFDTTEGSYISSFLSYFSSDHAWQWLNSWSDQPPAEFTDEGLANFLINFIPGDKANFPKTLYWIYVVPGRELLPPPPADIAQLPHLLDAYLQCLKEFTDNIMFRTDAKGIGMNRCQEEALNTPFVAPDTSTHAMREYDNKYGVFVNDYNFEKEKKDMDKLKYLKHLLYKEKKHLNRLRDHKHKYQKYHRSN